jgi:hypothetical protein
VELSSLVERKEQLLENCYKNTRKKRERHGIRERALMEIVS